MEFKVPANRIGIDPKNLLAGYLPTLRATWEKIEPKDGAPAMDWILFAANSADDPSVDDSIEIIRQLIPEELLPEDPAGWGTSLLMPHVMATVYWSRAGRAVSISSEATWSYLQDFVYWLGRAHGQRDVDTAAEASKVRTLGDQGRKGAGVTNSVFDPVRERAHELAREKMPVDVGWRSITAAAEAIREELVTFAIERKLKMVTEKHLREEWLPTMPDADILFPDRTPGRKRGA